MTDKLHDQPNAGPIQAIRHNESNHCPHDDDWCPAGARFRGPDQTLRLAATSRLATPTLARAGSGTVIGKRDGAWRSGLTVETGA